MNEQEWENRREEIEFRNETFGLQERQVKALESIAASLDRISKAFTTNDEWLHTGFNNRMSLDIHTINAETDKPF